MATDLLTIDSGTVQGRIHTPTGQIELAGPDRAGVANGTVVTFAPATAIVGGLTRTIGKVISSTSTAAGLEVVQEFGTGRQVRARLSFPAASVMRYEVIDWEGPPPDSTSISGNSPANEHFYGFGEKFNALDQAGNVVEILAFDNPGNKGDRSYKPAPWFVSTRGYGLHLDSTASSVFDMRVATGRYTITNRFGALRIHVVYGPKLDDVLSRYTGLTGRPPLPPPWAFGPWISSDIWRDGGEVRYAVEQFRQRNIPVSAFVFDSPWEVAYNDFQFNIGDETTQFGHPGTFENKAYAGFQSVPEMMAYFQQHGLKVICWLTPFVNTAMINDTIEVRNQKKAVADYDAIAAAGAFVRGADGKPLLVRWWKGTGSPFDVTIDAGRRALTDRLQGLLKQSEVVTKSGGREAAIGGFKTDDGEAATNPGANNNPGGVYIPADARYGDGRLGIEMQNGFALEYLRTVYSVIGANGLIFSRSGTAGTQAFPGCWAGDNEPNFGDQNGLPSVIVAGLSAAMSGFSIWGHDVGGYLNHNFSTVSPADLFIRWTQFGCFSPIMQMHRQVNNGDLRQYPWGYGGPGESTDNNLALENYRFYATLHTRLFPYLYTHARQSSETGLPIIRPLVLMHPDDPNTYSIRHTYYFGSDLLVAPIIQPNSHKRQVYLPEGVWFDFWTSERHDGGKNIDWTEPNPPVVPKSKIPVFARQGAIVSLVQEDDVQTICDANYVNNAAVRTWIGGLELRIYPAATSQVALFDGTNVRCDTGADGLSITIDSAVSRTVLLRIHAAKPAAVRIGGVLQPEVTSPPAFDATPECWRFSPDQQFIEVKLTHSGGSTVIALK
jgi:alpha-D-xyloside xylohydrolase